MTISQVMERAGVPAGLAAVARTMIRAKCPGALATDFSLTCDRPKCWIILEVADQAVYDQIAGELQAYVEITSEDRPAAAPGGGAPTRDAGLAG